MINIWETSGFPYIIIKQHLPYLCIMKRFGILIILLLLLATFACNDEPEEPDYGTAADLYGKVELYDDAQNPMPDDSVRVSIYASKPLILDSTDKDGKFFFKQLDYGTYSLMFEKNGYGTYVLNGVVHQKGDTHLGIVPKLGMHSTTAITKLEDSVLGAVINIAIYTQPAASSNRPRYFRVFFGYSDNVSFEDYVAYSGVITTNTQPATYSISMHKLLDWGFKPGDKVWIKAYGDSYYSNAFIDPIKGVHVFPNLNMNSAQAISFTMP